MDKCNQLDDGEIKQEGHKRKNIEMQQKNTMHCITQLLSSKKEQFQNQC